METDDPVTSGAPASPACFAWSTGLAPGASVPEAYRNDVPLTGVVLIPLQYGETVEPGSTWGPQDVPLELEVRGPDGEALTGTIESFVALVGGYWQLPPAHLAWRPSVPLQPDTTYVVDARADNPDCAGGGLELTFDFATASVPPEQQLADELAGNTQLAFHWQHWGFPVQCCEAKSPALCPQPDTCVACTNRGSQLELAVTREPRERSVYFLHSVGGIDPEGNVIGGGPADARDDESSVRLALCLSEYCVQTSVTLVTTGESVESELTCVCGQAPATDGLAADTELFEGNPCAEGSGPGSWSASDPPACWQYPHIRWFTSEEEGRAAMDAWGTDGPVVVQTGEAVAQGDTCTAP